MASWKTIQKILEKLSEEGLTPEYSDPHFHLKLDWEQMPEGVDPSSGFLKEKRLQGKRWQVENCIQLAESLLKGGQVIVDFCSGSGHLSIPMAYRFPDCHFILVERNPVPVEIGNKRVKDSGLMNIEFCRTRGSAYISKETHIAFCDVFYDPRAHLFKWSRGNCFFDR